MSTYYIEDQNGDFFSVDKKRRFIKLSGTEAYKYLSIHKDKRFYSLPSDKETDDPIYIEIPKSKIKSFRKEERHTQYLSECKRKSGFSDISFYSFEENESGGQSTGEEVVADDDVDVEKIVIHRIELEELKKALNYLSKEEQEIITHLYSNEPITIRELSKKMNVHYSTISRKHNAILRKLKKILKNS